MIFDEGDTDIDALGSYDQRGLEAPGRKIGASWDLAVPPLHWPALRTAATQGQGAFDAHLVAAAWIQPEAKVLYASLPQAWREAVRRGALGLAP